MGAEGGGIPLLALGIVSRFVCSFWRVGHPPRCRILRHLAAIGSRNTRVPSTFACPCSPPAKKPLENSLHLESGQE